MAFRQFAVMKTAIDRHFRAAVDGVVIEDRTPEDVGRQVGAYRDKALASAVALHDLRRGLAAIARSLGLLPPEVDLADAAAKVAAE